MAKKSFKSGLDNLLASAGIKKKIIPEKSVVEKNQNAVKKDINNETKEKHWLLIKNERLHEELLLWRTGKLSVEKFNSSLREHGLFYKADTNEIVES